MSAKFSSTSRIVGRTSCGTLPPDLILFAESFSSEIAFAMITCSASMFSSGSDPVTCANHFAIIS